MGIQGAAIAFDCDPKTELSELNWVENLRHSDSQQPHFAILTRTGSVLS